MKRLIAKKENVNIGDNVIMENNPTDGTIYVVKDIDFKGNLLLTNESGSYSGVKPSTVKKVSL